MKKFAVMAVALLTLAGSFSACGSSSDSNNVQAIIGSLFIQVNGGDGGTGAGSAGTMAGHVYIMAQAEALVLNSGSAPIPAVTWGASPTIIAANMVWTENGMGPDGNPGVTLFDDDGDTTVDDCDEMGYGDDTVWHPGGFLINPGVVVTLDDNTNPLPCGMVVFAEGPLVVAGAIVTASTNTPINRVDVRLESNPLAATDDQSIIISGLIDLSGADNTAGDAGEGGVLYVANDSWNGDYPIVVTGNLIVNGGDSTGSNGTGGRGGLINIRGGEDADVSISGNLLANGGDGNGTGNGGWGGYIDIYTNWGNIDNTKLGRVVLYNVNSIMGVGGDGQLAGGTGGTIMIRSSEAGVTVQSPIYLDGGDSSQTAGVSGNGGMILLGTNGEDQLPADLISPANLALSALISLTGGDALGTLSVAGNGGMLNASVLEGNFFSAAISVNGGNALNTDGDGGNAGTVTVVSDFATLSEAGPYWLYSSLIWAVGGAGDEFGGNGGNITLVNVNTDNSDSRVLVPAGSILAVGGDGDDTIVNGDGSIGNVTLVGNVQN